MSNPPKLDIVASDPIISPELTVFTPSSSRPPLIRVPEQEPLLASPAQRKPFYRARPLWLVPFAISAALVRGMTISPRVEVYTQLACHALHKDLKNASHVEIYSEASQPLRSTVLTALDPLAPRLGNIPVAFVADDADSDGDDPMIVPSAFCRSDSDVQAGAARLQTMMTITMGALSAVTTGWWGHFSERHGRNRVLAAGTLGPLLTDLTFILVSTPSSPLATHGHKLLIAAPIIEGLLGGWSALQAGISAYVSDCTSAGSRAHIFSRFTGVVYLGFSVGPSIGGWLIRNSSSFKFFDFLGAMHPDPKRQSVTPVFWVSVIGSLLNLILVLFVIPESLSKDKQAAAQFEYSGKGKGKARAADEADTTGVGEPSSSGSPHPPTRHNRLLVLVKRLFEPLAIFVPHTINGRRDWSLTFLALALSGYFLSAGIFQIKYLYAVHVYGWSAEVLSYYISFMGGARAVHLLFILPFIIATFKPQSTSKKATKSASQTSNVGHLTGNNIRYTNIPTPPTKQIPKPSLPPSKPGKPKLTKSQLAREIRFDLGLCRSSLMLDITSNVLVLLAPAPTYKVHSLDAVSGLSPVERHSQALFVMASSLTSFGCGFLPAVQSLALCILQARSLMASQDSAGGDVISSTSEAAPGKLFGALAVLQAIGQMILGPLIFGLIYSGTVATYPKAIFGTACGILVFSITFMFLAQPPLVSPGMKSKTKIWKDSSDSEAERGRSRTPKDLRVFSSSSDSSSSSSYGTFAQQEEHEGAGTA